MTKTSNIIGISGFKGSIGSTAIFDKNLVKIKSRLESSIEDIAEEFKDKKVSKYIHLAGQSNVLECESDPVSCMKLNSDYVQKFYKAAIQSEVSRFIFVSSSHVYDQSFKSPFDVDSPLKAINKYGESKLNAEKALARMETPVSKLSIARIFSVYSDSMREHFLSAGLIKRASKKDLSPIMGLDNIRDFLPASEAMNQLILLANSCNFPPIVNICSGKGTKIRDLAFHIFKKFGLEEEFHSIKSLSSSSPKEIIGVKSLIR